MGLTAASSGRGAVDAGLVVERSSPEDRVIALAGNPNVGKSTLFNRLTGLHQHTGNWPGKTVQNAVGTYTFQRRAYHLVDLPGCYSLASRSKEEEVAADFIGGPEPDAAIVVCDASCLERNLILVMQILSLGKKTVVCLNLMDEARRRGINIDTNLLEEELGVSVIPTSASSGEGMDSLLTEVKRLCDNPQHISPLAVLPPAEYIGRAEKIYKKCVRADAKKEKPEMKIDRLITGKYTAFPIMALFLALIFYLTITGANYPSQLLSDGLGSLGEWLRSGLTALHVPAWVIGIICDGAYLVTAKVVSVMLPPMAIFFPLFTLLEDAGFLPRIAFNLDKCFRGCKTCGKQSLTMCMGFGCNAAGIVGCRIIDSPRERLIAMLTNAFVPCNGRFPAMIALILIFFTGTGGTLQAALILTGFVLIGIGMTLLCSRLLSETVLRGTPEPFTLELPPYRKPRIGQVIVRSVFDRTLFVLGRAAAVAAPAGVVIWILANVAVGDTTLLAGFTGALDPIGRFFGMDGVILAAFVLGLPANELVVPVILMAYTCSGTPGEMTDYAAMGQILHANGWTAVTAVCVILFVLFHWPCSTALWTVKKESGKLRWALLAAALPTAVGLILCFLVKTILG